MRKVLAILVGVSLIFTSLGFVSFYKDVNAATNPRYNIVGITIDAPTYTSDPGSTTIDATITISLDYVGTISSTQTFSATVYLIRDDSTVDTQTFTFTAPSGSSDTTHQETVSLNTGGSTISYLKLVAKIKDNYTGIVSSKEKLLYSSNAAYQIKNLSPTSVKVPWSGVVEATVEDYTGHPTDGYEASLVYKPTNNTIATATITSGLLALVANIADEGYYYVESGIAHAVIEARYNFELTSPVGDVVSGDPVVISGKVTDGSGSPVSGISMCLYRSTDSTAPSVESLGDTTDTGVFAKVWDTRYDEPGKYYIGVCGDYHIHDYASITLKGRVFSLISSVSEVYAGVPYAQSITFTLKDGDTALGSTSIYYTVKNNGSVIYNHIGVSTDPSGKFTVVLPPDLDSGTLEIYVTGETSDGTWGEATLVLPVTIPDKIGYQISGLTNPLQVADYSVTVNALSNITPPATISDIKVSVSGPVKTSFGSSNTGTITNGGSFTLSVMEYGVVKITLDATDDQHHRVVKTFTYSVNGYRATVSNTQFVVGQKANISVKVTMPDGTPVNNAYVKLVADNSGSLLVGSTPVDTLVKDGTVDPIVGGVYTFTATLLKATTIDVLVYKSDHTTLMYRAFDKIVVNPKMDLSLYVSQKKVLAGFDTNITIAVKKDGVGVDSYVKLIDTQDNTVIATVYVPASSPTTTVTVNMNVGDRYEIYAITTDDSHGAKDYIEAVGLKAQVYPSDGKLTAGESEIITATLINPFNNMPISVETFHLVGHNVAFVDATGSNSVSNQYHINFAFTASVIDTSTEAYVIIEAINSSKVIYTQKLKVLPPIIDVHPGSAYVGVSSKFTITLSDVHGIPMGGKTIKVYQNTSIVGTLTTDDNGKAYFTYIAPSTGILTFKYGLYAEKSIPLQVDVKPPVVISVTPTSGYTATTDKVNVVVTAIDHETAIKEIVARNVSTGDVFYGLLLNKTGTVTAQLILRLEKGKNIFVIQAVDLAGNTSDNYLYQVTYEEPVDTKPPVILNIEPANGTTVTTESVRVVMEVADDTMLDSVYVDFKAIERNINDTHAIISFDVTLKEGKNTFDIAVKDKAGNVSRMEYVLYYHNPTITIQLRIGSQFYKVNDKTQILDAAPFIDPRYGRTMVPLRFIAEALGLTVQWNGETRTVIVDGTLGGTSKHIEIPLGKPKKVDITIKGVRKTIYEVGTVVYVDGIKVDISQSGWGVVVISDNRTFVPIRFIAELFGCTVNWNPPDIIEIVYTP